MKLSHSENHDHPTNILPLSSLLGLLAALGSVAMLMFPTKAYLHDYVLTSVRPVQHKLHDHIALPHHPAHADWSEALQVRLGSLEKKLSRLEKNVSALQVQLVRVESLLQQQEKISKPRR